MPEIDWAKAIVYAGPLALAAFSGTLLGGIALSFFWKWFGPWQILKSVQADLVECKRRDERNAEAHVLMQAEIADLKARHEILKSAVNKAGLGLTLGPNGGI